jgi:hypothetical protein
MLNVDAILKSGAVLDERAKLFSQQGITRATRRADTSEGIVLWDDLQRRRSRTSQEVDAAHWEWIFEPLIHEVLVSGIASWICVGHFTGSRGSPDRRWLYYLPEDHSPSKSEPGLDPQRLKAFACFLRQVSFNAECRSLANDHLVVTSHLIDLMTPGSLNLSFPYGRPLLLELDPTTVCTSPKIADDWRIWLGQPRTQPENVLGTKNDDRQAHLQLNASDSDVARHIRGSKDPVPFLWSGSTEAHVIDRARDYADMLDQNFGQQAFDPLGPQVDSLDRYWKEAVARDSDLPRRVRNYHGWIHDMALPVRATFTVPGWLPAEGYEARSGALIIAVREQAGVPILTSIGHAFRLGCSNWAVKTAGAQGLDRGLNAAIETFAHQIKGVAAAMIERWSVSSQEWEQMRTVLGASPAFAQNLEKARVMPVPGLYNALVKTLRVWAQSERVADLYSESPNWPADLRVLVKAAWNCAVAVRFATGKVNVSLSRLDVEDLAKLWSFEDRHDRLDLQAVAKVGFAKDSRWSDDDRKIAETWICAMTRLLAAAFDNYFAHGKADSAPGVTATIHDGLLSITVTNIAEGATADESRIRPAMTGTEVLRYLGEQAGGVVAVPMERLKAGEVYSLKIEVSVPSVIRGTDEKRAQQ